MEENKPKRIVGISGLKMDNSSISDSTINGSDSDANVGIFDSEMKDTNFRGLNISDANTENAVPKGKKIISIISKWWWKIAIPLLIGVLLLAIQQKWFL